MLRIAGSDPTSPLWGEVGRNTGRVASLHLRTAGVSYLRRLI